MAISNYNNAQWQNKDWSFFAALLDFPLAQHPEKESLALMLAGAALQLPNKVLAKQLLAKATSMLEDREELAQFVLVVAQLQLAKAQWIAGKQEAALALFQQSWQAFGALTTPLFYNFLAQAAETQLQQGDARAAIQTWQDIATIMQEQTPEQVYHRMSHGYAVNTGGFGGSSEENATWGDVHKHDLLAVIHQQLSPNFYFEIGVDQGLSLARATGKALGVDARPELKLAVTLPETASVIGMSSDGFFRELAPQAFETPPDLVFIDGMHLFEFALRDFMHIEQYAAPYALVGIDDIFPCHPIQAERRRQSNSWTGDVWKLIPILQHYRPDLTLLTLPCSTTGLLLITGLDANNSVLQNHYPEIMAKYQANMTLPESILKRHHALPSGHPLVGLLLETLKQAKEDKADKHSVHKRLALLRPLLEAAKAESTVAVNYSHSLAVLHHKAPETKTTLTLYWRTAETGFNETDTVKRSYDLNGGLLSFALPLPTDTAIRGLRLDIAGRSGCFFVRTLRILSSHGELLWDWALDMSRLSNMGQLDIVPMPKLKQVCMVSTGTDPQFLLNVPESLLPSLSGAMLELAFSAVLATD